VHAVLAFTGHVEATQQALNGALVGADEDSKQYWMAVVRLARDHKDETAHSILKSLSSLALPDLVRRSAAQHLERVNQDSYIPPSLDEDNMLWADMLVTKSLQRAVAQEERWRRDRRRLSAQLKAIARVSVLGVVLILIGIDQPP
jgi:hypothetical protein